MDFLSSKPHCQQSEEPGDQGSSCRSREAVSSPHSDVVSASQSGCQTHHAGDECQWQECPCDAITCHDTSFNELVRHSHHVNAAHSAANQIARDYNYIIVATKIRSPILLVRRAKLFKKMKDSQVGDVNSLMTVNQANELTREHTLQEIKGYVQKRVDVDCYVPTPPSPVPRAASKFLFNAHPAKHAAIKYKMKLMTNSGVAKPLPIPKAIAAARWKQCG